jgi:diguanylate cyclase (GGDEF)-like protein/PAS domain S-box-containing protein
MEMATILIVDDHILNRQFLMVLLDHSGHRLIEAGDGAEGLELAYANRPDLIIADIMMPNMDGCEFVKRLRAIPAITATPVIFHTAACHEGEASLMAMACGVPWVLPRPSDPETILRTVHEALGLPARPAPIAFDHAAPARLASLDHQVTEYLEELETSSDLMSRLVRERKSGEDNDALKPVMQRLSNALASLQGVNLRLSALIELGIELTAERDPAHLLEIGCRVVQDIGVAKYAAIGILDQSSSHLAHFVTRGMDEQVLAVLPTPAPHEGPLGTVLERRAPQRLNHVGGNPTLAGLPPSHPPVHSFLAVPISTQDTVFGWMYLVDKLTADEFSEVDERIVATVAAQLAVVYENLVLYREIQKQHIQLKLEVNERKQAQEALRRTLRTRTVRAECNRAMVHATDEAALLTDMCRTVVDAGGYHMAAIAYVNGDGSATQVAIAGADPGTRITYSQNRFASYGGVHPTVSVTGSARPWVVIDFTGEVISGGEVMLSGSRDYDIAVSLSLQEHGRMFALMTICEAHPNSLDSEQIAMLEELADDISHGVVILRSRAAREQAERALRTTEEKLSSILDSIDNVVWSTTETGFIYLNSMVEKVYGRPSEQFFRDRQLWFNVIHPDDQPAARKTFARLSSGGGAMFEHRIILPNGTVSWVETRARAILDDQGKLLRFDGVTIDINERKAYEARIGYLADHDALTGLANRNLLGDRLTQAMAHARRSGELLALLYLDLDRFKGINDSFGHEFGDELLLDVSNRLKTVVRDGDTVARHGGDEFILLLTAIQQPRDALAVAHKIFEAFSEPFTVRDHEVFVGMSIGATIYPDDGDDTVVLLRNADTAMNRAKEEPGSTFHFYSREMRERALERAELEGALRRALDRDEFELFYQSKVDAGSGRIIGAEALIRWRHPEMGMVSPTRFIPMAEEIGLIVPIGDWVLHTACAQNKAWQDAGLRPISVSVNLSARQFKQEDLVDSVAGALRDMRLDARYLELELTESMVMHSAELFITKLRALEELGVRLSIDDFGTGYSSLSYLKRFPLHHLKIDQSFVRDIATDTDDAAITSTVISLGHSLNLKVIAEGVETEEQVAFLREHHCDEMQGYYFSKPLPANEFALLLRQAA